MKKKKIEGPIGETTAACYPSQHPVCEMASTSVFLMMVNGQIETAEVNA